MNRASLMLAALDDGDWQSRRDLFSHACTFYLTNNAASELRALGYNVEQRRFEGNYEYRLQPSSAGTETATPPQEQVVDVKAVGNGSPSLPCPPALVEPVQLRLIAA